MDAVREKSKGDGHAHKKRKDKDEKKDPSEKEKEDTYVYATTSHQPDRTLFVVDLSRLKAERDTLENALVLYRPEADIKKVWMMNLSRRKWTTYRSLRCDWWTLKIIKSASTHTLNILDQVEGTAPRIFSITEDTSDQKTRHISTQTFRVPLT